MIHTRAGGIYEVMGTMTGKVDVESRTIYIMDAYALPVEGTETRVNAGDEAYEFMVEWQESSKKVNVLFSLAALSYPFFVGRALRECNWLVSLPSRLWLLAQWD